MAKKQDETAFDADMEVSAEPRVYELGFHIDPELPTEEVKKVYQAIHAGIAGQAEVVAEVEPEKIQLAYTISRQEVSGRRDFDSAYFAWIAYEANSEAHEAITTAARANSAIVRFIDLVTTKEEARHSVEAHELALQEAAATEVEGDTDGALDTEIDAALEKAAV